MPALRKLWHYVARPSKHAAIVPQPTSLVEYFISLTLIALFGILAMAATLTPADLVGRGGGRVGNVQLSRDQVTSLVRQNVPRPLARRIMRGKATPKELALVKIELEQAVNEAIYQPVE